ncbi:hypothetical protein V6N13_042496 [Hibiscus sabdariffa]
MIRNQGTIREVFQSKAKAGTFWYSFSKMPPYVKTIRNQGTICRVFQSMGVAETFCKVPLCAKTIRNQGTISKVFQSTRAAETFWYSFSSMPPCVETIRNWTLFQSFSVFKDFSITTGHLRTTRGRI